MDKILNLKHNTGERLDGEAALTVKQLKKHLYSLEIDIVTITLAVVKG